MVEPVIILALGGMVALHSRKNVPQPRPTGPIIIRDYIAEDDTHLLDLERQCIQGKGLPFYLHRSPWSARADQFERKVIRLAVDGDTNEILGVTCGRVFDAVCRGESITGAFNFDTRVAPSARGRGIGPLLTRDVTERLREMGSVLTYAEHVFDNVPSRQMFRKSGWQEVPHLGPLLGWPTIRCLELSPVPDGTEITVLPPEEVAGLWRKWFHTAVLPADTEDLASHPGVKVWRAIHNGSGSVASAAAYTQGAVRPVFISAPLMTRLASLRDRLLYGRSQFPLHTPITCGQVFGVYHNGGPVAEVLLRRLIEQASNECHAQGNNFAWLPIHTDKYGVQKIAPHNPEMSTQVRTVVATAQQEYFLDWFHDPRHH
eukprot:TRINITY_DN41144_c0_g1_i1.p1 TRINITY_DN41144_c0_g1~~TRINITY_DN41144_c0_g1_i1.p1  ORF type:complete len:373 (+),score=34.29 TRINITY_DN41144_c0_g1_i1:17-1135(+)